MIQTEHLCDDCARPMWKYMDENRKLTKLCLYCRGYKDGVNDTRNGKVNLDIIK
jgi:hypothetical protein